MLRDFELLRHEHWQYHKSCECDELEPQPRAERPPASLAFWKQRRVEDGLTSYRYHDFTPDALSG
jgi:hypothetical protein